MKDSIAMPIPEEYREPFQTVYRLFQLEDDGFEEAAKDLLKQYDDQETGRVRELLARWYFTHDRLDEGYALLKEMKAEENAKYPALLIEAQMAYYYLEDEEKVIELCDAIPLESLYKNEAVLLKASANAMQEDAHKGFQVLREALESFQQNKSQAEYLALMINALNFAVRNGLIEEHAQLVSELISFIKNNDLEEPNDFMQGISDYSNTVNTYVWPRAAFRSIAEAIDQSGWLTREHQDFLDGMYACTESFDAYEDPNINRGMFSLFQWLEAGKEDADSEWPIKWTAVSEYEKDPSALDYIAERYPYYCKPHLSEVQDILAHGTEIKAQAEQWMVDSGECLSKEDARNYLKGFQECTASLSPTPEFVPEDFGISCSEEDEFTVQQILAMYHFGGYEYAKDAAEQLLPHVSDTSGYLRYIRIMSLCFLGKGKQALKQIESMKAGFPDLFLLNSMEAMAYRTVKNFRKAEKACARAEAPYKDQLHFMEEYIEILGKLGKEDRMRTVVCDILKDIAFYDSDAKLDPVSKAFYYVGHVVLLMDDVFNDQAERLSEDTESLKKALLFRRPTGYAENEFARYITNLCSVVLEHQNYVPFFHDLLEFMERIRTFSLQNRIIVSGYSACESCLIKDETGMEECMILELINLFKEQQDNEEDDEEEDPELETRIQEARWYAAEILRQQPEIIEELREQYPYYMKSAEEELEEILNDPEAVKAESEAYLSTLTTRTPEEIRIMLNDAFQHTKEETENRKPPLS